MNSWCESCARKNCCYTMEIRPKCYLPTTNTAHGTLETYLAKSLRYSRDSHEIAEQTEPSSSEIPNSSTTEDYSMINLSAEVKGSERSVKGLTKINQELNQDPLHDDCFDCDKFFTCDDKGEDYKTDCPWK